MLFESDKPDLEVYISDGTRIAIFADGKFATDNKKTIKILHNTPGVHQVDLAGVDAFDDQTFETQQDEVPIPRVPSVARFLRSKAGKDE